MFIDTHCHLNMMVDKKQDEVLTEEHFNIIDTVVADAYNQGVRGIINVGTSLIETRNSIAVAQRYAHVVAAAGIHPCDLHDDWKSDFDEIAQLVSHARENKIVAIGETGLDYYHKPYNKDRQKESFRRHIELSLTHNLPLIIHVREAADDVLHVLEEYAGDICGVNHCFQQSEYVARQLIDWGLYLGIDGPITYPKNNEFRQLIAQLPLSHLILETDAPFLPPQEYRGKQNSPAYLPFFAQTLADLHTVSLEECAKVTTVNARELFNLSEFFEC